MCAHLPIRKISLGHEARANMLSVAHSVISSSIICVLTCSFIFFFSIFTQGTKEQARTTTKTGAHSSALALANTKKNLLFAFIRKRNVKKACYHAIMAHTYYTYIVRGFRVCGDEVDRETRK